MTALPVAFQSNKGKFSDFGSVYLLNAYAELQGKEAKAPLAALACDGLVRFATSGDTPNRGLIYLPDLDVAYAVHHSSVYKITSAGVSTRIGTVPGTTPVQLSRNQNASPQIVVQSDFGVQVIASDSVAYILDSDLPTGVISADYVSGYHVFLYEDRTFFVSTLEDATDIDALNYATFEQKAGKGVRVVGHAGELYGFCDRHTEVWRATGGADFPFSLVSTIQRGLMAPASVVDCNNALMFVGDNGVIYRLDNYTPTRISTHYIERLIQSDANQEDIIACYFSRAGHDFACFSGTNWTVCYDATTGLWHNRESYGLTKWRARYAMQAWGKTIVGDSLSGKLFYLDADTPTEDSETVIWGIDSPPIHTFPHGGICDALHFDMLTGRGTATGQGSDPKLMLWTSIDGGNEWGGYRELSLGAMGQYGQRVPPARKLGRFGPKGMVYRLRISDPVLRGLTAADAVVRPLKR